MAWGRREMKRDPRFGWGHVGIAVAAVVGLALLVPALVAGSAEPCCFTNDRYEGTCRVVPAEGETCGSILGYLNNPMSTGKTYCGNSKIRGGWVQVDCGTGKPMTQQNGVGSAARPEKPAAARARGASK
jgi:hypothetical protein